MEEVNAKKNIEIDIKSKILNNEELSQIANQIEKIKQRKPAF